MASVRPTGYPVRPRHAPLSRRTRQTTQRRCWHCHRLPPPALSPSSASEVSILPLNSSTTHLDSQALTHRVPEPHSICQAQTPGTRVYLVLNTASPVGLSTVLSRPGSSEKDHASLLGRTCVGILWEDAWFIATPTPSTSGLQ